MLLSQMFGTVPGMVKKWILTSSSWFSSTVMSCSIFDDNIFQSNNIAISMTNHKFNNDLNVIFLFYKQVKCEKTQFSVWSVCVSICRVCWQFTTTTIHSKCQNCWSYSLWPNPNAANIRKCGEFKYDLLFGKFYPFICIHRLVWEYVCFWICIKEVLNPIFIH